MSYTTTAIREDFFSRKFLALSLGVKPHFAAQEWTLNLVLSATFGSPLSAMETVAGETFSFLARS